MISVVIKRDAQGRAIGRVHNITVHRRPIQKPGRKPKAKP